MYRIITTYRERGPRLVTERGPWHPTRELADHWASQLRAMGYAIRIEAQGGDPESGNDNSALADALANMA